MLRLLLAFVLVVMVMGEGCCPPNAWEGFVGTMAGWVKDGVPHLTKMIEYFIMNGKCNKQTLARKVLNCIPENATRVLNTYMGAGPETMAVKVYRFIVEDAEVHSTVTSSGCIPVQHSITGTHPVTKAEFIEVVHVSGITVGVKNRSVFDIPSICHSADVSSDYVTIMGQWMPSGFY